MPPSCFLLLLLRAVLFVLLCNLSPKPTSSSTEPKNSIMDDKETKNEGTETGSPSSISRLPDSVIPRILSFLPIDQAVRASVLSQRWDSLWRYTNRLEFDQKFMFSSDFQNWVSAAPWPPENFIIRIESFMLILDEIDNIAGLISWLLRYHAGPLRSCKILHMIESCRYDHVGRWVKFLIEKKRIEELSLACEYNSCWSVYEDPEQVRGRIPSTLDICFVVFSPLKVLELTNYLVRTTYRFVGSETLKTLKLKAVWLEARMLRMVISSCVSLEKLSIIECKQVNWLRVHSSSLKFFELREMKFKLIDISAVKLVVMVFESVITRPKGLVIEAPKLRVFRCYCDPTIRGKPKLGFGRLLLTIKEIVGIISVLPSGANIFKNLVTLSFGLDLNNVRELVTVPFILRSCHSLENLEIHNEVTGYVELRNDSLVPYYDLLFWEAREACDWIGQGLNTVIINGYKGKHFEVRFVKYLIEKAAMLKSVVIWFDDDCTWGAATSAESLLSPSGSASANISITLNPGKEYLAEVGGSWDEWISYLKLK